MGTEIGAIQLSLNFIDDLKSKLTAIGSKAQAQAQQSFEKVGQSASKSFENGFNKSIEKSKLKIQGLKDNYQKTLNSIEEKENSIRANSRDVFFSEDAYLEHEQKILSKDKAYQKLVDTADKSLQTIHQKEKELEIDITSYQEQQANKREQFTRRQAEKLANIEKREQEKVTKALEKQKLQQEKAREKQFKKATKSFSGLGKSIKRALKSVFLMTAVYAAFRTLKTLFSGAMADNKKFSESLNAVKANLMTAFTPIVQSVMPMLEKLMAGLARVTTKITSFIAGVFGKTYAQVIAQTKKLSKATSGASSKKGGSLAGFDEINQLSSSNGEDTTGINYDAMLEKGDEAATNLGEKFRAVCEKIKTFFAPVAQAWIGGFDKVIEAGGKIYNAVAPGFTMLWENVLYPIAIWFRDTFAEAFDFIGEKWADLGDWFSQRSEVIDKVFKNIAKVLKWLWEKVWEPIFNNIKNFVKEVIDNIGIVLGGFADFLLGVFTGDVELAVKGLKNIFVGLANCIISAFESALNVCVNMINALLDIFKKTKLAQWVEDKLDVNLQLSPVSFPRIPAFANGGVISQPTLGLMGEYSGAYSNPEIVAPQSLMLETFTQAIQPLIQMLQQLVENISQGQTVHIHLDGSLSAFAKTIKPYLDAEARRRGGKVIIEV